MRHVIVAPSLFWTSTYTSVKCALYVPVFNDYAEPAQIVELACLAEASGWDGIFIWDHIALRPGGSLEVVDATVTLAAVAQATSTIQLGPMISPLARRRPWKFAKEIATLDRLSKGRVIVGTGLGEPVGADFESFGEDGTSAGRASRLDEGLSLLDRFLRDEEVDHVGKHYSISKARLRPTPVQQPRPPIWVAACLPYKRGFRRAAQWEGCFPLKIPSKRSGNTDWTSWWLTPPELNEVAETIDQRRGNLDNYVLVSTGSTNSLSGTAAKQQLDSFSNNGANWWLEWIPDETGTYSKTAERIDRGPPSY